MKVKYFYNIILLIFSMLCISGYSQKKRDILFKINGKPQLVSDFLKNYNKNIDIVADKNQKDINNYLNLYIDYKLKILEAKKLKLDTIKAFKVELQRYKKQLMMPYLKDTATINKLAKQAYYRTKYEVNVSHILIRLNQNAKPKDTILAYKQINKIWHLLKNGSTFTSMAKKYSQDPSVKINGGNLGYFNAFTMVYKFENEAYNTKVDSISKPFKTRFGYHIIKVNGKRLSKGQVKVAHIMLKNKNDNDIKLNKTKIDSIYILLQKGADFKTLAKKYSQDKGSAKKGGLLPKFSDGKIIKSFSNQAFALKNIGDYSKPFRTPYGWHIVKLIKKYKVLGYNDLKSELINKVKRGDRSKVIEETLINNLTKKYTIINYKSALNVFYNKAWVAKADSLQKPVLKIQDSVFTQHNFATYLKKKHIKNEITNKIFQNYKNQEVINYYKAHLARTNPDFANTINDFRNGLLLFNVMQKKVWQKSKLDSIGLKAYYMLNRSKYPKDFENHKGQVISDYQNFLEKTWIETLRKNHKIKINKSALKKLNKHYQ